ncbi:hypothetical protein BROUX41_000960 [Berkeleyomyces rouxiae]|uniref:uncharacterized protein n=1 Tax=Berkeleyomyces rouxiae TaxID=2035830 RepID=UPI003B79FCBF
MPGSVYYSLVEPPSKASIASDFTASSQCAHSGLPASRAPIIGSEGLTIQRPRSALHTGNFSAEATDLPSPSARSPPQRSSGLSPIQTSSPGTRRLSVYRNSLVLMAPTSPLIHSASPDDVVDHLPLGLDRMGLPSPTTAAVYKPAHGRELRRSSFSHATSATSPLHHHHLPHNHSHHGPRTRRLSSTDHASLIGSYEESLLRGRMSTTPSRPLTFNAQIGVMGRGNCKPSLKCPAHVTLPFQAVFYDYPSKTPGTGSSSNEMTGDGGPSPYVGTVDLENGLRTCSTQASHINKGRRRRRDNIRADVEEPPDGFDVPPQPLTARAPIGGSYRIPQAGQLQIVVKNPHKTAIKLFLVPYDLSGMPPGTKTFLRQRCYSSEPSVPRRSSVTGSQSSPIVHDRTILRYLVHINICSPSKGRFYLHKDLRLVFANRTPDSTERLRTETTGPEPRFSAYRTIRPLAPPTLGTSNSGDDGMSAAKAAKAQHALTRSYGDGFTRSTVDPKDMAPWAQNNTMEEASIQPVTSPPISPRTTDESKPWDYQKLSPDKVNSRVSSPGSQSLLTWGLWAMNLPPDETQPDVQEKEP